MAETVSLGPPDSFRQNKTELLEEKLCMKKKSNNKRGMQVSLPHTVGVSHTHTLTVREMHLPRTSLVILIS